MRFLCSVVTVLVLLVPSLLAQEDYSEGPVWRVTLIRVKPAHMDQYLSNLRQGFKPFVEELKRQGFIVDYKVFFKETKANPQDWDICTALEFKNHAALDGLGAKEEAVRDKIFGGKQAAQQGQERREEIREIISEELLEEVSLK
jgi:hypothetical protein